MKPRHENLTPGTKVPETGVYECCFCGQGGIGAIFAGILPGSQGNAFANLPQKAMRRHFSVGAEFDQCPNCGIGTGWSGPI